MKELAHFAGLKIDTTPVPSISTTAETPPQSPGPDTDVSPHLIPIANGVRRSDTSDSLTHLIRRSPSLSNLQEITSFPSPVVPSKAQGAFQRNLFDVNASPDRFVSRSPLSRALQFEDGHGDSPRSMNVLPPKVFNRLRKDDDKRHVSLNVSQPVSSVEMPPMIRHRSQSRVPNYENESALQREPYLATTQQEANKAQDEGSLPNDKEVFDLPYKNENHRFVAIRELGKGTFSRVVLAHNKDPPFNLVAIKVVELLASGKADKARVEMTVRREVNLLQKLRHPLIVDLYGFNVTNDWAHLVLEYCSGGDLFSLASDHKSLLTPFLVRRLFAEVVSSVLYLHQHNIIHRDLKLENVLLRLSPLLMTYERSKTDLFTTLTDLGLAREFDPLKPEVITRCGSEDYAAPEIVMGQAYDGRQTDAWALGALLYCLLEGRLPFDVIPGLEHKMKTKVLHRICRIEWRWVKLKDRGTYDDEYEGAKRIVTNLLRSRTKRWTLDQIASDDWIRAEVELITQLAQ